MSESDRPAAPDPWASVPNGPAQATPPGAPVPGYGPYPPPGIPPYSYPGYQARRTNGLSIAALVCGICGFIYLVPAVLGVIFGIVALRQINRDKTDGKGMAIAGIVVGAVWISLVAAIIVLVVTLGGTGGR